MEHEVNTICAIFQFQYFQTICTCEDLGEGYAALVVQKLAATFAINQAEKPG